MASRWYSDLQVFQLASVRGHHGKNGHLDHEEDEAEHDAAEEAVVLLRDAAIEENAVVVYLHNADVAVVAMAYLLDLMDESILSAQIIGLLAPGAYGIIYDSLLFLRQKRLSFR